jgi:class 3 adenylate cyclase
MGSGGFSDYTVIGSGAQQAYRQGALAKKVQCIIAEDIAEDLLMGKSVVASIVAENTSC